MMATRCFALLLTIASLSAPAVLLSNTISASASTDRKASLKARMNRTLHDGHFKQSFAIATQVLEIDPTDTDALVVKGCSLTGQTRPKEAEPYFRKAMELKPNRPDYIAHHIADLVFLRRFEDAKKELPMLYAIDPNFDYGNILELKIDLLQGRTAQALEKATRLLRRTNAGKGLDRELSGLWDVIDFDEVPRASLAHFAEALEERAYSSPSSNFLRALTVLSGWVGKCVAVGNALWWNCFVPARTR